MDVTTQAVAWILALAPLVPLLTAVVLRPVWPKPIRVGVSVAVAALAGLVGWVTVHGTLDLSTPSAMVATIVGVVVIAQAAYAGIWKGTGVTDAIEAATSPKPTYSPEHAIVPDALVPDMGDPPADAQVIAGVHDGLGTYTSGATRVG